MTEPQPWDRDFELAVRSYLARLARRSLPLVALIVAVVLVVVFVDGDGSKPTSRVNTAADNSATAGDVAAGDATATTAGAGTAVAGATGGGASSAARANTASASGQAAGRSRTGVTCGGGARQVTWTKYAPLCTPAFSGDNGGATSPGVTKDTITLTYRRQNSGQQAAIQAIAGEATPVDSQYLHDLNVFLSVFNQQYELYGRKVVVKDFQGRGDYLSEDVGQGQDAANADAVTAKSLGGFADITFPSAGSLFYAQGLTAQKIIGYDFPLNPQGWYEQNSPYQYNTFVSGTNWARWAANLVCQRMKGMPAVFAGDAAMHSKPRVFGLVNVEFPTWSQVADDIQSRIDKQCGVPMVKRARYAENIGTMQQDAATIAAQMKAAGVTTLLCFCDPLMPIFLSDAATQQSYRPEWIVQNDFDPITQDADQSQLGHAMAPGPSFPELSASEAYAVYKLGDPHGEPASIYFPAAYELLLHLLSVVQTAGPHLTPTTFRDAAFALPPSLPGGQFGIWTTGPGAYTPVTGLDVVWWDANAMSPDGKKGHWRACDSGKAYSMLDPAAWGSGQMRCFA